MVDALVGQQLGQYTLAECIGQGGMGVVYRAHQPSIGREVAIKVLPASLIEQNQDFRERFLREAKVAAQLQHPHIITVHDFGEQDGTPYIVMAFIGGGSLADHIKSSGAMPVQEVLRVVQQLVSALDYAHGRGVIHRDVKPGNVLFDESGNAYLADFGLAKMAGSGELTATGTMLGTPDYMAPDWANQGEPTPSVDLYSLGVMTYQMLAGEVPYKASTPMGVLMAHVASPAPDICAVRPDLPVSVGLVVQRAMAKMADQRYASAGEFAAQLEQAVMLNCCEMPPAGQLFMPNAWGRMAFTCAERILGVEETQALLMEAGMEQFLDNYPPDDMKREFPFETSVRFSKMVREVYGRRGAQSVGRLAGQYVYQQSQEKYKGIAKVTLALVQAAAPNRRVRLALDGFTRSMNAMSDVKAEVDEDERYWIYRVTQCYGCYGWDSSEAVCYTFAGMLEGFMKFLHGGQSFRILETECKAQGYPACVFLIEKP